MTILCKAAIVPDRQDEATVAKPLAGGKCERKAAPMNELEARFISKRRGPPLRGQKHSVASSKNRRSRKRSKAKATPPFTHRITGQLMHNGGNGHKTAVRKAQHIA